MIFRRRQAENVKICIDFLGDQIEDTSVKWIKRLFNWSLFLICLSQVAVHGYDSRFEDALKTFLANKNNKDQQEKRCKGREESLKRKEQIKEDQLKKRKEENKNKGKRKKEDEAYRKKDKEKKEARLKKREDENKDEEKRKEAGEKLREDKKERHKKRS